DVARRRLPDVRALVAAEEEQPIPSNRPTERPAKLVAIEAVVLARAVGAPRGKLMLCVEAVVAPELERVAVEQVRARLRDGVDRRARVHAAPRRERARLDAELLQRV